MAEKLVSPGKGIFLRRRVYWFRFSANGKQRFVSLQTSDPVEAVKRAVTVPQAGEFAPKTGLEAEIDRFILAKRARGKFAPSTELWARRALKHLQAFFPGKSVASITSRDMERFVAHLLARQSETGAMSYLRGIKSFFSWARGAGRLRFDNPCAGLVRVPKEPARLRFATKAQRDALIAACESQRTSKNRKKRRQYHEALHFALFCALHAGMRYNEIIQARPGWFHLDAAPPYVEIQNTDTFRTKNRRNRTVPLSTPFVAFLRRYGLREPFMLAPHKQQMKSAYRYDFRKPWSEHVAAHDVPWLTPHAARHTFASLLVQSGESIFKVAKWMGHGVAVCERHYAHLTPGDTGIDRML